MRVDPMFTLSIEDRGGQAALRLAAAADLEVEEESSLLFEAPLEELAALGGASPAEAASLARPREALVLSNGWQSWSFAGELAAGERVRRARVVPILNLYTDGPGRLEAPGEFLTRFVASVRAGKGRLVLASRGEPGRATPPVSFRIGRGSLAISAEITASGAGFRRGELVAEIRAFYRESWFEARDALREAFREHRLFERLAFLGSRGGRLVPGGYESWYNHYTRIDDGVISRDLEAIGSNGNLINAYFLGRGMPTVFQIDDGWEAAVGDWVPHAAKFPRGMRALAEGIERRGLIPGLWLAPLLVTRGSRAFRERSGWLLRDAGGRPVPAGLNPGWDGTFFCLDISLPEVEDYLAGVFDEAIEGWGYRYLKLDFLYAGFLGGGIGGSGRRARFARGGAAYAHYDRLMRRLTSRLADSKGRPVAWLGCGAPLEPSYRHFPLMRIGADTKEAWEDRLLARVVRHQGRPAAYANLTHTIGRAMLDGAVFANDPDVVFCRTARMSLTEPEKELVALAGRMLASQVMFSDDPSEFGGAEEAAFTSRIVGLFDRLEGGEYGAERVARDVYSVFSRDGRVAGIANLSGRRYSAGGRSAEPRSISLSS